MIQRCVDCHELCTLDCFDSGPVCRFCTDYLHEPPSFEDELIQLRNKLALSNNEQWHLVATMLDQILGRHLPV